MATRASVLLALDTLLDGVSGLAPSPTLDVESVPSTGDAGLYILRPITAEDSSGDMVVSAVAVEMVAKVTPKPTTRLAALLDVTDRARAALKGAVLEDARAVLDAEDFDTTTFPEHAVSTLTVSILGELPAA